MRSVLFVFLMGAAFYVMADQLGSDNGEFSWILYISGLAFAVVSNVFNLELTRVMQLGFIRLSFIERELSSKSHDERRKYPDREDDPKNKNDKDSAMTAAIQKHAINYFSAWEPREITDATKVEDIAEHGSFSCPKELIFTILMCVIQTTQKKIGVTSKKYKEYRRAFDETFTNYFTYILLLYMGFFLVGGALRVFSK